jgi:hypothetical protein
MGQLMAPEDWMVRVAQTDQARSKVMWRLVRMQILTANKVGHVVFLGSEYHRRAILHSARHGRVARVVGTCSRCQTQAWLSDWIRACIMMEAERNDAVAQAIAEGRKWQTAFLLACPGAQYNDDIMSLASTPAEER